MLLVDSKDPAKIASVVSAMMPQLSKPKPRKPRKLNRKAGTDSV